MTDTIVDNTDGTTVTAVMASKITRLEEQLRRLPEPPSRISRAATLDRDLLTDDPDSRSLTFIASTSGVKRDRLDLSIEGLSTDNFMANPVFLWAHDYSGRTLPIGKVTRLRKLKNRMDVEVEFDQSDEFAQRIEQKYRDGYLNAVSIGWNVLAVERGVEGVDPFDYRITESDLLDVSAVPVPGDAEALIKTQRDLLSSDGFTLIPDDADSTATPRNEGSVAGDVEPDNTKDTIDEIRRRLDDIEARLESDPHGEEPSTEILLAIRDSLQGANE